MILRIGCVPFLNARPLLVGLEGRRDVRVVYAPPSRLAALLRSGRVDVALLPVFDLFDDPSLRPVAGVAIAARGPAGSVRLLLRRPVRRVRTLALDRNSRTSNALARVLLALRYGVRPRTSSFDPARISFARVKADAAVVIGDNAFREGFLGFPAIDLSEAWRRLTGLPFVFAVWAVKFPAAPKRAAGNSTSAAARRAKEEARFRFWARLLRTARDRGLRSLKSIAAAEAGRVRLTPVAAHRYLARQLRYRAGPAEEKGLRVFQALCGALGLCREVRGINWIR